MKKSLKNEKKEKKQDKKLVKTRYFSFCFSHIFNKQCKKGVFLLLEVISALYSFLTFIPFAFCLSLLLTVGVFLQKKRGYNIKKESFILNSVGSFLLFYIGLLLVNLQATGQYSGISGGYLCLIASITMVLLILSPMHIKAYSISIASCTLIAFIFSFSLTFLPAILLLIGSSLPFIKGEILRRIEKHEKEKSTEPIKEVSI
jgi:hypothetical protein